MAIEEFAEDVVEIGGMMDENVNEEVDMLTPSGAYTVRALNILVEALNEVLPMFNMPDYPLFETGVEGPLPEEFVRQLLMVDAAAVDADLESFPMDEAVDDRGLEMIAGRLKVLARDKTFKRYVEQEASAIDFDRMGDEEMVEEEVIEDPEDDVDVEALFMERMR
tara:strand:- start:22 stop:516 length:495 start_codon:yes stop_codon:yes gene_type:complete